MKNYFSKKDGRRVSNRAFVTILLGSLLFLTVGITYAAFNYARAGSKVNSLTTGTVTMTYNEGNNKISLTDAMPLKDCTGEKLTNLFDFSVNAEIVGDFNISYEVTAKKDSNSTLSDNDVRLYLEKSETKDNYKVVFGPNPYKAIGEPDEFGATKDEMILDTGTVTKTSNYNYKLRMWVSENYKPTGDTKYFSVKVNVYGKDGEYDTSKYGRENLINEDVKSECGSEEDDDTPPKDPMKELCPDGSEECKGDAPSDNSCTNTLAYDKTDDNNLRYIGKNPCNYVLFNNELWRIVGSFNNIDDGTGKKETRMKLIKNDYNDSLAFDENYSNDYSASSLNKNLNGNYYDSFSGISKALVGDAVWNLGGTTDYSSSSNGLPSNFYTYERGTNVPNGHNKAWTGKIGIMYPSDFGYATSGGSTRDRKTCLAKEMYNWDSYSDCRSNDYLYDSSNSQMFITPYTSDSSYIFNFEGYLSTLYTSDSYKYKPVLYLKSAVKILSGTGTENDPYVLAPPKGFYLIEYNLNGGENPKNPDSYTTETETFTLNNPTKKGYTFLGWTGSNGKTPSKKVTIEKGTKGNKKYTANWNAINYKITYDLDGGVNNKENPATYIIDDEVTLKDPTKEDSEFLGWSIGDSETVSKNITIAKGSTGEYKFTAHWKSEFKIDYDLNGGEDPKNPTEFTAKTETFTLKNPTKKGYSFVGWTGSNGKTPETTITIEKGSIGDRRYRANWKASDPKFTDDIEEKCLYTNEDGECEIDAESTCTNTLAYDGTKDNNLRYYGNNPCNYVKFNNELWRIIGVMYNTENSNGSKAKRIKLVKDDYYLTDTQFDKNNVNDYSTSTIEKKLEDEYYKTFPSKSRNLVENNVWNIGGVDSDEDSWTLSNLYKSERNNKVYEVHNTTWTGHIGLMYPSDFGFATNGGNISRKECLNGNLSDRYDSEYGKTNCYNNYLYDYYESNTFITPINTNSRGILNYGDYLFSSDADSPYSSFKPSIYIKSDIKKDGGDGSKDNPYTLASPKGVYYIDYELNGGNDPKNPDSFTENTETFTLKKPKKTGYDFNGWTGSNGDTPDKTVTIAKGTTGDKNYTANWSPTKYKITYNLDGGTNNKENPDTYTLLDEVTLKEPTREGAIFLGWSKNDSKTVSKTIVISQGSTGDVSFTAHWQTEFNIKYNLKGGKVEKENPSTYTAKTETFTLNEPTREGFTFEGWTGSNGDTPEKNVKIEKGSIGDKEYTAYWGGIASDYISDLCPSGDKEECNIPSTDDSCTNTLAYDDTTDTNLRYVGKNPCNYAKFNNELWRIVGVMKNVDDGTGKKEDRVKLIRKDSIGSYSWDTNTRDSSDNLINFSAGINEWSQADLMKLMNPGYEKEEVGGSLYWNRKSGKCYNDSGNESTDCNFAASGLNDASRIMIGNAVWNLGTTDITKTSELHTGSILYSSERGSITGKQCEESEWCNDTVERTTKWTGKVGLMYPSDFVYATSGGSKYDRNYCTKTSTIDSGDRNTEWYYLSDCYNNDWLYNDEKSNITINPQGDKKYANYVTTIYKRELSRNEAYKTYSDIRPTIYLNNDVSIYGGNGSEKNPYKLRPVKGLYLIDYDLNGGTDPENPHVYSKDTETFTLKNSTKMGYTFTGWTGSNGKTPEKTVTIEKGSTGDKNYKANFKINNYKITYNLDNGVNNKDNPDTYTINDEVVLKNPTKEGSEFLGWSIGDSENISKNVTITKGSTGDFTFTAHWKSVFNIEYDLNGGEDPKNPAKYTAKDATFTLKNPTREGYTFSGWTGSCGKNPIKTVTIEKGSVGDKRYKAHWKADNPNAADTIEEKCLHVNDDNECETKKSEDTSCTNTLAYDDTKDENLRYYGSNPCNYVKIEYDTYSVYFDGNISTESPRYGYQGGSEYPTLDECNSSISNNGFTTAECTLDTDTNKYYIEAHEIAPNSVNGGKVYDSESACKNDFVSYGLSSSNGTTPKGISCKINTGSNKKYELWRIIGVMNNTKDKANKNASRLKLVRTSSNYSAAFDSNNNNDYSISSIKNTLNRDFLNKYSDDYKSMIEDTVWNLGSPAYGDSANSFYTKEHSKNGIYGHSSLWTGKVGLIYPSDYGYATGGGNNKNRASCLNKALDKWQNYDNTDCKNNNYLSGTYMTITPYVYNVQNVFAINNGSINDNYTVNSTTGVYPSIYLRTDVKINGGTGSESNPYTITVNSYEISYDLNGGTDPKNPSRYTKDTETFTLKNPTKDGLIFLGWTGSNGNTPEKTITIKKGSEGNRFYKANWAPTVPEEGTLAAEPICNESSSYDETEDNNLRCVGKDPDNYVLYNGELWRIIGVFNNVDDGTGKKESRVKMIRNEALGAYSFDSSTDKNGKRTNYYGNSTLKDQLNDLYYNKKPGDCFINDGTKVNCNFGLSGLSENSKKLIGDAVWNTEGINDLKNYGEEINTPKNSYIAEHSSKDENDKTSTWTGKIGLISLSDYGFATDGGSSDYMPKCLNNSGPYDWYDNTNYENKFAVCSKNDWLLHINKQWTITPYNDSSSNDRVVYIRWRADGNNFYRGSNISEIHAGTGQQTDFNERYDMMVRPTVFLKAGVKKKSGSGTIDDPYILDGDNSSRTKPKTDSAADTIRKLAKTDTTNLTYDKTAENNIRYIGSNPNNYVSFNGELWRIIGVMNNIDDGTGKKESRVKIIRDDVFPSVIAWNTSEQSFNFGYGINDWTQSSLMKILNPGYENNYGTFCTRDDLGNCSYSNRVLVNNSLYWNRKNGSYYSSNENIIADNSYIDFSSIGLTDEAKKYIGNAVWTLTTTSDHLNTVYKASNSVKELYESERRGSNTGKIYDSPYSSSHPLTWKGKVGLMYPTDYGFATSGSSSSDSSSSSSSDNSEQSYDDCISSNLIAFWKNNLECGSTSWLKNTTSYNQYTITAAPYTNENLVFSLYPGGGIYEVETYYGKAKPTVYLKSTVKIYGGDGTSSSPYKLSLDDSKKYYNLSYNLDGGSDPDNPEDYPEDTLTFTLNNPTRTGYEFLGWTGSNGDTPSKNVKIEKGTTGDKTYTANWKLSTYNITYDLDGGSVEKENPSTYQLSNDMLVLNNPKKEGYKFLGWTTSDTGTPQRNMIILTGSTGDINFKAHWKKINYANTGIATSKIESLYSIDKDNLAYDGTKDNNLRYIGKDPNNYISFNNELWRIIGIFNVSNGTSTEKRLKVVRNSYSHYAIKFDSSGSNDYSSSSLKSTLNGNYYSSFSDNSKSLVDNAVWNIGAISNEKTATAADYYKGERGTNVYSGHNTTWTGKLGLIYPSDSFYATGGGTNNSRNDCLSSPYRWADNNSNKECVINDWLRSTGNSYEDWTITPMNNSNYVIKFDASSGVMTEKANTDFYRYFTAKPASYLKADVAITDGNGTPDDPYILGIATSNAKRNSFLRSSLFKNISSLFK